MSLSFHSSISSLKGLLKGENLSESLGIGVTFNRKFQDSCCFDDDSIAIPYMWHDITPDNCSAYQFITGFEAKKKHIHLSFPTASLVWPRSAHPKQPWPTRQLCKSKSKKSSTNSVQLRNECPRQKGHRCTKKQHQHKKQIPPTKITLKKKSKSYQSFIPTAYKFLSTSHSNQESTSSAPLRM